MPCSERSRSLPGTQFGNETRLNDFDDRQTSPLHPSATSASYYDRPPRPIAWQHVVEEAVNWNDVHAYNPSRPAYLPRKSQNGGNLTARVPRAIGGALIDYSRVRPTARRADYMYSTWLVAWWLSALQCCVVSDAVDARDRRRWTCGGRVRGEFSCTLVRKLFVREGVMGLELIFFDSFVDDGIGRTRGGF